MSAISEATDTTVHPGSALEVLRVFTRLGLTSFGGPIVHFGFFRIEFVERRRWLDEAHYADVVALSQFLPGPASSKVGILVGVLRAGMPGALAAWIGFTMPSALALILFGYGVAAFGHLGDAAWLYGLKIVAVAVVAQAVWGMARNLCSDRERATIAVAAAVLALAVPSTVGQVGAIVAGTLIGWWHLPGETMPLIPLPVRISRWWSTGSIVPFFALLIALPIVAAATGSHVVAMFDGFYRSGSLVFGGGHVVLPLLQATVVPPAWVDNDAFLAGYGAAQAVPYPLFIFSAYLGTVMGPELNGWLGGLICLVGIFLPSFFLAIGPLHLWNWFRQHPATRSVLKGINAAVVGLLLAALYNPVWMSGIHISTDFALGIVAFLLLTLWSAPPWFVAILVPSRRASWLRWCEPMLRHPQFIASAAILATLSIPSLASAQQAQTPTPAAYRPGLGDLMTMTVQPRHTKLGLAGREGNWSYAAYELHELQEAFDRAVAVWPKWRTFSTGDMMSSTVKEPMAALDQAIKARDPGQFASAYSQLTAACNTCHQSAERGIIVIQQPMSSSFPDQDFRRPTN